MIVAFVAALAGDLDSLMVISAGVALGCFVLSRDKLGMIGATLALVTLRLMAAAVITKSWKALLASFASLAVVVALFRLAVRRKSQDAKMAAHPWSREKVKRLILAFVDNTSGRWDWDDFMCAQLDDPELEALQSFGAQLPTQFPPTEAGWYASAAGLKELRSAAERLLVDDTDPPV